MDFKNTKNCKIVFANTLNNLIKIYKFYTKKDLKTLEKEYLFAPQRAQNLNEIFEGFIRALQNGSNIGPKAIKFDKNNPNSNYSKIKEILKNFDLNEFSFQSKEDLYKNLNNKLLKMKIKNGKCFQKALY